MQPIDTNVPETLSLKELAIVLVKHFDRHEGTFEIVFGLQVGIGPVGPSPEQQLPGAAFAIENVGLIEVQRAGANTIDAAEINPAPRRLKSEEAAAPVAHKKATSAKKLVAAKKSAKA